MPVGGLVEIELGMRAVCRMEAGHMKVTGPSSTFREVKTVFRLVRPG
jgi:hypothetical protein